MAGSQSSFQEDFPHVTGLDIINLAIDECVSAKAFRLSAMSLLTSQDLYILIGSISDDLIDVAIRKDIKNHLHHNFSSGQLCLFADHMFNQARSAPSEYYADYYYSLYQAALMLVDREEYLEFAECYQQFSNDNSEQVIAIKKQIDELQKQIQGFYEIQEGV